MVQIVELMVPIKTDFRDLWFQLVLVRLRTAYLKES
jgi:hypothetical protein